jgi:2-oxoglutarate ferredoxin oxidoreductase subunit beta
MIVQAIAHAADELNVGADLTMTAGIGCSAWIPMYLHVDVLKGLHGRAIPAAVGLKASRPARKVVTVTGDGDCLAIGGNHLLHACRRNIDITVIMVNNQIYAMTGGQVAPSTPFQGKTQTTPYGSVEGRLDGCKVAIAAGATHVSRWSTAHIKQLTKAIKKAINHKGFSYIEVVSQCPVQTGPPTDTASVPAPPISTSSGVKDLTVKQEDSCPSGRGRGRREDPPSGTSSWRWDKAVSPSGGNPEDEPARERGASQRTADR